jgi:outer membrane protein TolC
MSLTSNNLAALCLLAGGALVAAASCHRATSWTRNDPVAQYASTYVPEPLPEQVAAAKGRMRAPEGSPTPHEHPLEGFTPPPLAATAVPLTPVAEASTAALPGAATPVALAAPEETLPTPDPRASGLPSQPALPGVPTLPPLAAVRGVWPLTLDEAHRIAMENSAVVRVLSSNRLAVPDASSFDPGIEEARAMEALAAFDTSFDASLSWNRYQDPPDTFFGPGIPQMTRRDDGSLRAGLGRRWFSGAETRLTYNPTPGYLYFPNGNPNGFNPANSAVLELCVRQPLARGAVQDVVTAPLQVTQLRTEGSAWEFKQSLLDFIRSIEQAYWELQGAKMAERTIAQQVALVGEVVRITQAMYRAERAIIADVAKARAEFHELRLRLLQAQTAVQEKELQLRTLMNVPTYDGRTIDPITPAVDAPFEFDRDYAVRTALNGQPMLLRQRVLVQIAEVDNLVATNGVRPQFDVLGLYRANGLDNDLGQALSMMAGQQFHDWEFGARYSQPLGNRAAQARKRAADLQLIKQRTVLDQQMVVMAFRVVDTLREIDTLHAQYLESRSYLEEVRRWLKGAQTRYLSPPPAAAGVNWLQTALDDYLKAMRAATDGAAENASLLARYNTSLAQLAVLEGTLLRSRNIQLMNDPAATFCANKLSPHLVDRIVRQVQGPRAHTFVAYDIPDVEPADSEVDAFVASRDSGSTGGQPSPQRSQVEERPEEIARLPPVE